MMNGLQRASNSEYASWILAVLAMLTVIHVRLLPALIAGLLVYQLVHVLAPFFARHLSSSRAREVAVGLLALLVFGAVTAAVIATIAFLGSERGSLAVLLAKMAEIIESSRSTMPAWLAEILPRDSEALRESAGHWLREHSTDLQLIGKETSHLLVHLLIGMIIVPWRRCARPGAPKEWDRWRVRSPKGSTASARPSGGSSSPRSAFRRSTRCSPAST